MPLPLLLGVGILILILLVWWFFRKRKKCTPLSGQCLVDGDCCDGYHCLSGQCNIPLPPIHLFAPFSTGEIGVSANTSLQNSNGILVAGPSAGNFAVWDGVSTLSFATLVEDANGHTSVNTLYLAEPVQGVAPRVTSTAGKVLLTQEGKILSFNQQLGLSLTQNGIIWDLADKAMTFSLNVCPTEQTCAVDSDCCGPIKKCNGGKCQKCFGDLTKITQACCDSPPCTTIGNDYTIVCDETNNLKCQSKCGDTPPVCPSNAQAVCSENEQNQWNFKCVSKCTGDPPTDCASFDCRQDSQGNYNYFCIDPECHPRNHPNCGEEKCDASGLNCTYTLQGQAVLPQYDCGWRQWKCNPTCPADACKNMQCPSGQYPKCDNSTNFGCICVADNQPDFCGSIPKPPHDDAVCRYVDESNCGGPPAGWRWYVEDEITDNCQLAAFHAAEGWKEVVCTDDTGNGRQIMLINGVPVYPTIDADNCRGASATAVSPDPNIHNPTGHIRGQNTSNCQFTAYDPKKHNYYASPAVKNTPFCLIDDQAACHGGQFVLNTNPSLLDIPSAGTSPTPNEIVSANVGHCNCPAHTSGLSCEYNSQTCSGHGDPIPVPNNPDAYTCSCAPGYYGANCNYTVQDCNNNGVPLNTTALKCSCQAGFSGSRCQYTRQVCNYQGSPDDNGVCLCDPMFSGKDCLTCISPTVPLTINSDWNAYYVKIFGYDDLVIMPVQISRLGKMIWVTGVRMPCREAVGKTLYDPVSNTFQLEWMTTFYLNSANYYGSQALTIQNTTTDTTGNSAFNFRVNKCGFLQDVNGNYFSFNFGAIPYTIANGLNVDIILASPSVPANLTGMLYLSKVSSFPTNTC